MVERDLIVGLVVECLAPVGPWGEPIWRPVQVIEGAPDTPPWTVLATGTDRIRYFAGSFPIRLYSSDTAFYRDNLTSERPQLWVAMCPDSTAPHIEILAVTADPTEGEGYTQTGTNIVEVIDMPPAIAAEVADFIAEHHVERVFEKRKRDKRPPEMVGRRRHLDTDRS